MKSFYSLLLLCGLGLTAHAQIDSVAHVIKGAAIANMPVMLGEPDVLKALQTQTGVSR